MTSYNLEGITAADVKKFQYEDLYDIELTNCLYDIKDKSEFLRIKGLLIGRANALGFGPDYKDYLGQLEIEIDDYNEAEEYNHQTAFGINNWPKLNCGKWIADKKGVRKKNAKIYASLSPIQPIEILENISTGTEKVKIQFFKNGRTRYLITDRNTIAAKSQIVKLASQGIEVTSETAGQLVSYLSDVINLNPLPYSTAYSQMGWQGDEFIPYDEDAVFDGEESNRYLFKSFTQKGDFSEWCKETKQYRENIAVRLAMGASFASVLLDRVGALPFVFHLWGKSGTGKTVALMIAMSIWGNPKLGATVRTMNMTQNALIGQAAFLNSLPFAGDELQTIKERHENYDKLIMRCTEGVDRGRMIDAVRAAESKRWKCAFLFTGEDKCTRPNSGAGVKNRCIEVEVDSELLEGQGNSAVNFIERNYGHAGEIFVRKLQQINCEGLRAEYNSLMLELAKRAGTEPKQAAAMALIMLADTLAREAFWKDEKPLCYEMVKSYMATSEEIDIAERAYQFICDHIARFEARFNPIDNYGEIWGKIEDNIVYFNCSVLKEQLQKEGFEYSTVARSWAKKGYTVRGKDGRNSVSASIQGQKNRFVLIKLPEVTVEDDTDYDEVPDLL